MKDDHFADDVKLIFLRLDLSSARFSKKKAKAVDDFEGTFWIVHSNCLAQIKQRILKEAFTLNLNCRKAKRNKQKSALTRSLRVSIE